jgi:hypothetical protein
MRRHTIRGLFVAWIVLFAPSTPLIAEDYLRVPAGIHFDSDVSGGKYSVEALAKICRKKDLEVAIITDHDNMRVEYGVFPLRKVTGFLIRKWTGQGEQSSISSFGAKKYLRLFEEVSARYPELILMPGAEAIPFYYWEGNPWKRNLRLMRFHEHLLVIGLKSAEDYRRLPSIANGYPGEFSPKVLINLIWGATALLGFHIFRKKRVKRIHFGNQVFKAPSHRNQIIGALIFLASLLLLINNYPFLSPKHDQYHGDQGGGPYQVLIDYVNQRGGMVFWAHPEVEQRMEVNGIEVYTPPYHEHLLETHGYTGFAIFWEGMNHVGKPGGIWDRILNEYCQGKRKKPVWAIGELDFEGEGNLENVKETATVLSLREKSRKGVLEALRTGRMYATRNFASQWLTLEEFSVGDSYEVATMGGTLRTHEPPHIRIKFAATQPMDFRVQVIRDGKIIGTFPIPNSGVVEFDDRTAPRGGKVYYRILASGGDWVFLASNPIFVEFE